jgi:Ser/Thr protein kinase RdoA (MazF antagonist)
VGIRWLAGRSCWFNSLVISKSMVCSRLAQAWGLTEAAVVVHDGGMNSSTWLVDHGDRRWVAKAVVPEAHEQFVAGLAVARMLQEAGIPAGAPLPTIDGHHVTSIAGYPLALLTWVPGDGLTGESGQQLRLIGTTLAAVHRALAAKSVDGPQRFHWVDPTAAHLTVRPWVRPAVAAAVDALEELGLDTLSWGLLHTDPAPEAFRLDPTTGVCGVIDWSVALHGPHLYDLASAVMYVGGVDRAAQLIDAYLSEAPLTRAEVDRGLLPMLRFRWAAQADYFAKRILANDSTGITGPPDNEKGLEDARRRLTA